MRKVQSQTGINMLKAVEKFNEKITSEGRPSIGMGAVLILVLLFGRNGAYPRHSYDVPGIRKHKFHV